MGFLFPAHAGVIPMGSGCGAVALAFPRTRGGDPLWIKEQKHVWDHPRVCGEKSNAIGFAP